MKVFKCDIWKATLALFLFLASVGSAESHELWVNASPPKAGIVRAELGYGDLFPIAEPIPEDRVHIFESLQLLTPEGSFEMERKGENYTYELARKMKRGSALILARYKPTFWSKGSDGTWAQTDRKQRPDAAYVEEAAMYGKTIISIDGGSDRSIITKPVGFRLEIVPLVDPATIKPGGRIPIQVLLEGKPLEKAEVLATFAGFSDNASVKAFRAITDSKGMADVIPLKAGYWNIGVETAFPYADESVCDEVVLESSLTFHIKD